MLEKNPGGIPRGKGTVDVGRLDIQQAECVKAEQASETAAAPVPELRTEQGGRAGRCLWDREGARTRTTRHRL